MSDRPKNLRKTGLGTVLSLVGASGVSAWLALGDFHEVQSDTHTRVLQIADAASNNNHDVQSDSGSAHHPTQDYENLTKPNKNIESYTPKELADNAKKGHIQAADELLDMIQSNPMSKDRNQLSKVLPDFDLTEDQYETITIARTLRQLLNELTDPNLDENATMEWKINYGETPTQSGCDSIQNESYISGRITHILNLFKFMTPEDAESETFLNLAEMSDADFEETLRYYLKFDREFERNALLNKFGFAE